MEIQKLSELVRQLEEGMGEKSRDYAECKATMIVNFGPNGRESQLIKEEDRLLEMLVTVIDHYMGQPKGKSLIELEAERLKWSLETFTEATAVSSLRKLESEIEEIEANIIAGVKDPMEYADAMMCILDAAGRDGITIESIIKSFAIKLDINKNRTWNKNPDNSYSHVKSAPETLMPPPLPTNLDEAVEYLLPRFNRMGAYLKKGEDYFASFCHSQMSGGIGMKIRNELQLWVHESQLHQYFLTNHNLFHPDEMSDLIIRHVYRKLKA